MKRVLLVDAKNLIYRTHFTHASLTDEEGRSTSVLHGFPSALLDSLRKFGQSDVVIVWDDGLPNVKRQTSAKGIWRKQVSQEYKANRVQNDEAKKALAQIPKLAQLLDICGYLQIGVEGLEADDLMGLADGLFEGDPSVKQVQILSNDRDHFQLIGGKTMILYPARSGVQVIDSEACYREFGVWPEEWSRYKALAGDSSDSFKAVKGIGPKLAIRYLRSGVNPAKKAFTDLPPAVQREFKGLRPFWERIHQCYILSRIPRSPDYRRFPAESRPQIDKALFDLQNRRERKFHDKALDTRTRDLIRFLGSFNLTHLMGRKREFFANVQA